MAGGAVIFLVPAAARSAAPALPPMLMESDIEAKPRHYKANASGNTCAVCSYYTESGSAPGTGSCGFIVGKRVSSKGSCDAFRHR